MKRPSRAPALCAAVLLAVVVLLVAPGPRADAQSPAPATPDTIAFDTDEPGKPWGRLAIFIPVSLALGAGAVYGRRIARARGWFGS